MVQNEGAAPSVSNLDRRGRRRTRPELSHSGLPCGHEIQMTRRHIASPLPTARPLRLPASVTRVRPRRPAPVARSSSASRIGVQVRALRMAAGLSAGQLALASGISASMLSRIERGLVSPSVETLERLAQGLHVPVSRFFGDQARRTDFCHVRAGQGLVVDRVGAVADYRYELLVSRPANNWH